MKKGNKASGSAVLRREDEDEGVREKRCRWFHGREAVAASSWHRPMSWTLPAGDSCHIFQQRP